MPVEHIDFHLEEPSTEEVLHILLPRLLPDVTYHISRYQGKQALLRKLPDRLKAYAEWLLPTWRIVVLVDKDADDCLALKADLEAFARESGLITKSASGGADFQVVNRIAVEELEAWFFGDWQAVCRAFPRVSPRIPQQARYRTPDAIAGGTAEALERILQKAGYFSSGLRKTEAACSIAAHMNPDANTSHSFQVFRQTLAELTPP